MQVLLSAPQGLKNGTSRSTPVILDIFNRGSRVFAFFFVCEENGTGFFLSLDPRSGRGQTSGMTDSGVSVYFHARGMKGKPRLLTGSTDYTD